MNVACNADDLPRGFIELRSNPFADDDLLADGVFFGPVFLGHGLIDDNDARRAGHIAVGKVAATQDRYLESLEVAGGGVHPAGADRLPFVYRPADNEEWQAEASLHGQAASRSGDFHPWNGIQPLAAITYQLGDSGCLLKAVAGQ